MLIGFESPAIISSLALLRYGQMKQGLSILSGLFYLGLPNYFKPNNSEKAILNYVFFARHCEPKQRICVGVKQSFILTKHNKNFIAGKIASSLRFPRKDGI